MANSPKDKKPENSPSGVDENSYALNIELHTIEDMGATPQYIKALERERMARELDAKRPRFVKSEKSSTDQPSEMVAVLNSAVAQISKPANQIPAEKCAIGTIYKGRIFMNDAVQHLGWNEETSLSFTFNIKDGITIISSNQSTSKSRNLDNRNRCIIPPTARNLLELNDGSNVLIFTSRTPIDHVRIIPIYQVIEALAEREN